MAVPKAAVDEQDDFSAREHNVGTPRQVATVEPKPQAHGVKSATDDMLGRGVLAFDAPHILAAVGRRQSVHR
jgi:hypothetical protein